MVKYIKAGKNQSNMNIRKIEKSDIPDCVRVIRESFLTVADEFGFTEENAPRFTGFSVTQECLMYQYEDKNRLMYAYFCDNAIVGYYSICLKENGECELNNLSVLPDYRHRGIGEKLLLHSFEAAKAAGCQKMFIGIVEENTRLRKWYESFGVEHIGTEKFDFFPFTCGYMEKIIK